MIKQYSTILGLVIALMAIVLFLKIILGTAASAKYKTNAIMSGNEIEFFGRLKRALPDFIFFPR